MDRRGPQWLYPARQRTTRRRSGRAGRVGGPLRVRRPWSRSGIPMAGSWWEKSMNFPSCRRCVAILNRNVGKRVWFGSDGELSRFATIVLFVEIVGKKATGPVCVLVGHWLELSQIRNRFLRRWGEPGLREITETLVQKGRLESVHERWGLRQNRDRTGNLQRLQGLCSDECNWGQVVIQPKSNVAY